MTKVCGIAAFVLAAALPLQPAAQQAQTAPTVLRDEYELPPNSLGGMWASAAIVVRGRVVGSEAAALVGGGRFSTTSPVVYHQLMISEVFKGPAELKAGQRLTVAQPGGVIVTNGRQTSVDDRKNPVFQQGDEYVLFLMHWPAAQAYSVKWGAGGTFTVRGNQAFVPAAANDVAEFRGKRTMPVADLLTKLRALRTGK